MFVRLGKLVVRRRRPILVLSLLFTLVAMLSGVRVFGALSNGGFEDPDAASSRAERFLEERFGEAQPNVVMLVTATDSGSVDDPAVAAAGAALTERLVAAEGVTRAVSYWSLGSPPPLRSDDGDRALALVRISGTEDEIRDHVVALEESFAGDQGPIEVAFAGAEPTFAAIGEQVESDLKLAEIIAVPITLVLLLLVFGSVVAAGLPLLVGLVAVVGTFLSLFLISTVTDVSVFSINLTTALGLGLAIDYSLFIVSRFREELANGRNVADAVVRTVDTAGRTVAFSALTVAVSLAALLVFPLYFLRSFAYAGIAVVLVAAVASVVSLPALLATIGHRVDAGRLLRRRAARAATGAELAHGFWHRVATTVMKRPVTVAGVVIVVLLLLGAPFRHVAFGLPDDRVLPADTELRQTSDAIRTEFSSHDGDAFPVVAPTARVDGDPLATADIDRFARQLSALDGVGRVDSAAGSYAGGEQVAPPDATAARFADPTGAGATWWSVVPTVEPVSPQGEDLVDTIRALDAPESLGELLVGGSSAELVDTKASIADRLPWAAAIIVIATFVLLFLLTGSVLVPVKAVVLNLLSLTATFGAMVWVFQDGNGADLLGFTATGTLDVTTPILMFCIAFGLSMDYEVFLLSRIKEEHDRTGDNVSSVALGLERTGRIVSAAALLLAVTFVAFASSGVTFLKVFGLGLALAIVMDATVVRGLLVPAFMRLAGEANWWAPAPLRRLHERFGLSEGGHDDHDPTDHDPTDPTDSGTDDDGSAGGGSDVVPAGNDRRRGPRELVASAESARSAAAELLRQGRLPSLG